MTAITLDLSSVVKLTDEQYYKLATAHQDLRMERNADGTIEIMAPTGGNTGKRNFKLTTQLGKWVEQNIDLGEGFDSSTEFKLSNGANRCPDASWVSRQRWEALTPEEREKFPPLCPDFVIELRSPSDSLQRLQEKMREYRENGTRLGWLIDPQNRKVEIYRMGKEVEVLENPATLSGENVLPGFVLNLRSLWD
jgi:Uma2 family endonuclease